MITLADVQRARRDFPPEVLRTPLMPCEELSQRAGISVYLKPENLQVTGSYKARAAFTVLNRLAPDQKARGAAISSSGNFAAAWAYMGRLLRVRVAVVAPENTVSAKLEKAWDWGAEIVLCANDFDARWDTLFRLEQDRGILAVDTYEHPDVMIGHGSIGAEIAEDLPDVETVLVPVSSGSLLAGVAVAIKGLRPSARVIGVQPSGSNALHASFHAGEIRRIERVETICDALVAARPGRLPFAHVQRFVDDIVLVSDEETVGAVRWLAESAKLVVEPGGAVCAAALLAGKVQARGPLTILLSGGNVSPGRLPWLLAQAPD